MGRAPCCDKVGLKRGRWTAEEDDALANYIAEHGEGSWRSLPKNAGKCYAMLFGSRSVCGSLLIELKLVRLQID
jgi:hypothetical protein